MAHRDTTPCPAAVRIPDRNPAETAHDRHWAGRLRGSIRRSAAFWVLPLLVDWCAGALTPWRALLWLTLAALLFTVVCPARVSAGQGWLDARGLLRKQRVRTDRLTAVHWMDGVAQRLVLRDTVGGRVEIDPRVLADNPALWHRLAEDARVSAPHGPYAAGITLTLLGHRAGTRAHRAGGDHRTLHAGDREPAPSDGTLGAGSRPRCGGRPAPPCSGVPHRARP